VFTILGLLELKFGLQLANQEWLCACFVSTMLGPELLLAAWLEPSLFSLHSCPSEAKSYQRLQGTLISTHSLQWLHQCQVDTISHIVTAVLRTSHVPGLNQTRQEASLGCMEQERKHHWVVSNQNKCIKRTD